MSGSFLRFRVCVRVRLRGQATKDAREKEEEQKRFAVAEKDKLTSALKATQASPST